MTKVHWKVIRFIYSLYSVQCTVYSVQCTLYSLQCIVRSTLYPVHCTLHTVLTPNKQIAIKSGIKFPEWK